MIFLVFQSYISYHDHVTFLLLPVVESFVVGKFGSVDFVGNVSNDEGVDVLLKKVYFVVVERRVLLLVVY